MAVTSLLYEVQFRVNVSTSLEETVCLTGNIPALGAWDPHKAIKLQRETSKGSLSTSYSTGHSVNGVDHHGDVWSRKLKFDCFEDIQYRYFVCQTHQSDNEDEEECVIIKRWETNIKPRVFSLKNKNAKNGPGMDVFGTYGDRSSVTKGWLTDQSQVNIDIHGNPIKMWQTRYKAQTYSIRCSAVDHFKDDEDEEDAEYHSQSVAPSSKNSVLVSVLENGSSVPVDQGRYGVIYKPNTFMTFMIQTLEPETTGYHLDFFVHENTESENNKDLVPRLVGYSLMLPVNIGKSKDIRTVPITSLKHKPLGQIQVECLLVKPLMGYRFSMEVSYQLHWKKSRKALDIGHRGMGTSYSIKKLATVRENTVESMKEAASHGADYVELDVHLSKDRIPVIYHDFKIHIAYRKKRQAEMELFEVSVKDIKLAELQSMKLFHTASPENKDEIHTEDLDPEDLQPFPMLKRCLEAVDKHTGFNIEIKYPQFLKDGDHEQENYFDMNQFLDIILRDVFTHHSGRRIIFSSFHCDICIALRLKQNRFPVLLLTQADTTIFPSYSDVRTHCVMMAAEFAQAHNLLGVDAMSEVLLENMSLVDYVKDAGLVLFVWGEANNDTDTINSFKEKGVDAIIYDRIDHYKDGEKQSIFKVEHEEKLQQLHKIASTHNQNQNHFTANSVFNGGN